MKNKINFVSAFLFSLVLLSTAMLSCINKGTLNEGDENLRIPLDGTFEYAICPEGENGLWGEDSTVEDALQMDYAFLEKMCYRNLYALAGGDG